MTDTYCYFFPKTILLSSLIIYISSSLLKDCKRHVVCMCTILLPYYHFECNTNLSFT